MIDRRSFSLLRAVALLWLVCALSAGCNILRFGQNVQEKIVEAKDAPPVPPGKRQLRVSQFLFLSDGELKGEQAVFKDLEKLRDQVIKELAIPTANTVVYVYLFPDRERYDRFMKSRYPDLPERRAFFVAQPRAVGGADDLIVYTFWGERVHTDLRHELTHALLHSVLKDVPLWLDEGLAEYFEQPAESKGVSYRHLEILRLAGFPLDVNRLEQVSRVQDMKEPEYREAWAWVHWMLQGSDKGKEVLQGYLQQLRTNPTPGPLQPRLAAEVPDVSEVVRNHLKQIEVPFRNPSARK